MKWTKRTVNNLFFAIGVTAVVVMMLTFDVSFTTLAHNLRHAGLWLIPILGIWIFVYAINAVAWRAVIKAGAPGDRCPVGFGRIYLLTIIGYALNYATPIGGLGGEPYRIVQLSRDTDKEHATSSVILYSMMHMYAHFWFWFVGVFMYLALAAIGDLPLTMGLAAILLLITAFCLLGFYVFSRGYRNGFVRKAIRLVGKLPGLRAWSGRFLTSHDETLSNIDRQIAALHSQKRNAFIQSLTLEYFGRVTQSLEIMFVLLLFGVDCGGGLDGLLLTFLHSILIVAFTTLFANVMGFLPMQLGVKEGGFVLSIAALGLSPELGIFVSIISRVREIFWIFVGIVLMRVEARFAHP